MNKFYIVGCVLALVIVSAASFPRGFVVAQERPNQPVQKWEYQLVKVAPLAVSEIEASFNQLGSEGWELCATVVPFRRAEEEYLVSFIFKRPKD